MIPYVLGKVRGIAVVFLLLARPAFAAGGSLGEELPLWSVIPFVGILLSIAFFPLLAPHFWHRHFGKISAVWALLFLVPFAAWKGVGRALDEVGHVYALEFVPFILLLWALYTVSGGIRLKGRLRGTPAVNLGLLLVGTVLASWMGTTGAAMLLVRPLIRANEWRRRKVHLVVFFIFLVANIGGSLTPLGDPPLFLGFLKGVDFFWTTTHMLVPMLVCVACLGVVFFVLDTMMLSREAEKTPPPDGANEGLGIEGGQNLLFLLGVVGAILYSGMAAREEPFWDQAAYDEHVTVIEERRERERALEDRVAAGSEEERPELVAELLAARSAVTEAVAEAEHEAVQGVHLSAHVTVPWINVVQGGLLLLMGFLSLRLTSREIRRRNDFTWFPIVEVAKLFAGIFVTMIPAIAILRAGPEGALAPVILGVTSGDGSPIHAMYFWLTGLLSSFLDNAPTYLVFFNTAGGNAAELMAEETTLLAISTGAVFMGAMTYIGNAPNFMVRSIAAEAGVAMPSFFGYMVKWSVPFLVPVFVVVSILFF